MIVFPEVGTYTCDEVNLGATLGLIPLELCSAASQVFHEVCVCRDAENSNDTQSSAVSSSTVTDAGAGRSIADGLYRSATDLV
jgi:hypothetical protein